MKWLRQKLVNWLNENDRKHPQSSIIAYQDRTVYADGSEVCFKDPLNITLYNVVGGRIVKFSSYDRATDKSHETTYIVAADENFEEALGKFITIEAMKHVR